MKLNLMSRIVLAVVLCVSLITTGCSAQWVSVALADLPVLTQMALNIAALAATLQSGRRLTPAEIAEGFADYLIRGLLANPDPPRRPPGVRETQHSRRKYLPPSAPRV